jgi:hypothetical protein
MFTEAISTLKAQETGYCETVQDCSIQHGTIMLIVTIET